MLKKNLNLSALCIFFLFTKSILSLYCIKSTIPSSNKECVYQEQIGIKYESKNCSENDKIKKFTFMTWLKLPKNFGYLTSDKSEVIFSAVDKIENQIITSLQFNSRLGFFLKLNEKINDIYVEKTIEYLKFDKIVLNRLSSFWTFFLIVFLSEGETVSVSMNAAQLSNKLEDEKINFEEGEFFVFDSYNEKYFVNIENLEFFFNGSNSLNLNFYNCLLQKNSLIYINYAPKNIKVLGKDNFQAILFDHFFLNKSEKIYLFLNLRIQELSYLQEVHKKCAIEDNELKTYASKNPEFIQKGYLLKKDDFFECFLNNQYPLENLTISFRIKIVNSLSEKRFFLFNFVQKNKLNFYTKDSDILNFEYLIFGIFLNHEGKLCIEYLQEEIVLSNPLQKEITYLITLEFIKIENYFTGEKGFNDVLLFISLDGIRVKTPFFFNKDFSQFFIQDNSSANSFFFIGNYWGKLKIESDNISSLKSFNEKNYTLTEEEPLVILNDIIIGQNTILKENSFKEDENCLKFLASSFCLKCKEGYILNYKMDCVLKTSLDNKHLISELTDVVVQCQDGNFYNYELKLCQRCPEDCFSCESIEICYEKKIGCQEGCLKCSLENLNNCLECKPGYRNGDRNCVRCLKKNCLSCNNNILQCDLCEAGFFLNPSNNECQLCDSSCFQCESLANNCTACLKGFYLDQDKRICVEIDKGFFIVDNIMRKCPLGCTTCLNALDSLCTSCDFSNFVAIISSVNYFEKKEEFWCKIECPDDYFYFAEYNNKNGHFCAPCQNLISNCERCISKDTEATEVYCLECKTGFYLFVNLEKNFEHSCDKCSENCKSCYHTTKNCTQCFDNFKLKYIPSDDSYICIEEIIEEEKNLDIICLESEIKFNNNCFQECPSGYFKRKTLEDECTKCEVYTENCFDCNNRTGVCNICKNGFILNQNFSCEDCFGNKEQCCEEGYGVIQFKNCLKCEDENCLLCPFRSFCLKCNNGFVANSKGQCKYNIKNCLMTNFLKNKCMKCEEGLYFNEGLSRCVLCENKNSILFKDGALTCENCNNSCFKCSYRASSLYCEECAQGYFINYFGACQKCKNYKFCKVYSPISSCVCLQCFNNYYTIDYITHIECYENCPLGFFLEESSNTCQKCERGCNFCISTNLCQKPLQCREGNYLADENMCCPLYTKYDLITDSCITGLLNCAKFINGNCIEPKKGYFLKSSNNILKCPEFLKECVNDDKDVEFGDICLYGNNCSFNSGFYKCICVEKSDLALNCEYNIFDDFYKIFKCEKCFNDFVLNYEEATCIDKCNEGFSKFSIDYSINLTSTKNGSLCLKTDRTKCDIFFTKFGETSCHACQNNYYRFKTDVDLWLINKEYINRLELIVCGKCHSTCSTCQGPRENNCLSCNEEEILINGQCVKNCPNGFELINNKCFKSNCQNNHPIVIGKMESSDICSDLCPYNQFLKDSKECTECQFGCMFCTKEQNCRSCDSRLSYFLNENENCQTCDFFFLKHNHSAKNQDDNYFKFENEKICSPFILKRTLLDLNTVKFINTTDTNTNLDYYNKKIMGFTSMKITQIETPPKNALYFLIRFNLLLHDKEKWENGYFRVKLENKILMEIFPSKWDFETQNGFENYRWFNDTKIEVLNREEIKLNSNPISIDFEQYSLKEKENSFFYIDNLVEIILFCPPNCEDCDNAHSCNKCKSEFAFFHKNVSCEKPFTNIVEGTNSDFINFLNFNFKPYSFFLISKFDLMTNQDYLDFCDIEIFIENEKYELFNKRFIRKNIIEINLEENSLKNFLTIKIKNSEKKNTSRIANKNRLLKFKSGLENQQQNIYSENLSFNFSNPLVKSDQIEAFKITPIEFKKNLFQLYENHAYFDFIKNNIKKNYEVIVLVFFFLNLLSKNIFFLHMNFFFNRTLLYIFTQNSESAFFKEYVFIQNNSNLSNYDLSLLWAVSFCLLDPTKASQKFQSIFARVIDNFHDNKSEVEVIHYTDFFDSINLESSGKFEIKEYLPFKEEMVLYSIITNFVYNFDIVIFIICVIVFLHGIVRLVHFILKKKFFDRVNSIKFLEYLIEIIEFKSYIIIVNKAFFPFLINFFLQLNSFNSKNSLQIIGFYISLIFLVIFVAFHIMSFLYGLLKSNHVIHKNSEFLKKFKEFENQLKFVEKEDYFLSLNYNGIIPEKKKEEVNVIFQRYLKKKEVKDENMETKSNNKLNKIIDHDNEKINLKGSNNKIGSKRYLDKKQKLKNDKNLKTDKKKKEENFVSVNQLIQRQIEKTNKNIKKKNFNEEKTEKEKEENKNEDDKNKKELNEEDEKQENGQLSESESENEEEIKKDLKNKNQPFGKKLGDILKSLQRRRYFLRCEFITKNKNILKIVNIFQRTAKYYHFVTNFYKTLLVILLYFLKNNLHLNLLFLIFQAIYLIWFLLTLPFKNGFFNFLFFVLEAIFLVFSIFLNFSQIHTLYSSIFMQIMVFFIIIIFMLVFALTYLVISISQCFYFMKKLDFKNIVKEEDDF